MYGKLEISGVIESLTGLHIGGGSQFAAIGAVDSVVIKDIQDDLPMIPGSSLKGKLRSLLSKQLSDGKLPKEHNQDDEKDFSVMQSLRILRQAEFIFRIYL